ncbi:MAG: DUF6125 family protein [bacterium]
MAAIRRIEDLPREELVKRLRLAAELASAMDGLWFVAAEQAHGFDRALELDVQVWERYGAVSVKRIRKYFPIDGKGLAGVKEVLSLDPFMAIVDFEVLSETPDSITFQAKTCPFLEAMERYGRKVFTCEQAETAYFRGLARAVDPRIRVAPLKLPPRQGPDEICCRWLFSIGE